MMEILSENIMKEFAVNSESSCHITQQFHFGIYLTEIENTNSTDITALSTVAKIWNQATWIDDIMLNDGSQKEEKHKIISI